jgi:electron transfer flavoprotein beta subunit
LEASLRIKENHGAIVVAISMGEKLAQPVLRKALAAGVDELILLMDPNFKELDSQSTAYVLSRGIQKVEGYDLILTGRQASDWDFGITGLLIADILKIPAVNLARNVDIQNGKVLVEKLLNNGYEIVKTCTPALVTVSSEIGDLRYTSVRSLQAVSKKPIKVFNALDLELDPLKLKRREVIDLFLFNEKRQCKFIDGESSEEKGENLAIRMKGDGII